MVPHWFNTAVNISGEPQTYPDICEEQCDHPHHERPQEAERVDGADDADAPPSFLTARQGWQYQGKYYLK